MARWKETRPQCLRPYPRRVRGEAEGADRGDEGRNCGSAATERYGPRRWETTGGEERQTREEGKVKRDAGLSTGLSVLRPAMLLYHHERQL